VYIEDFKNKNLIQRFKERIEDNTKMPPQTFITISFSKRWSKKEAIRIFISFIRWIAKDAETHILPLIVIERKEGRCHIHSTLCAPKQLKYRLIHKRWFRNQGLSHHVNYKMGEGAIHYMYMGHQLVEIDQAVICPCKGRGRCRRKCKYDKYTIWNLE